MTEFCLNKVRCYYINNSLHLRKNMHRYLFAEIIFSEQGTVFREEQIMSKDKYPSIILRLINATLLIILRIAFATRAVLEIVDFHSDILQI